MSDPIRGWDIEHRQKSILENKQLPWRAIPPWGDQVYPFSGKRALCSKLLKKLGSRKDVLKERSYKFRICNFLSRQRGPL